MSSNKLVAIDRVSGELQAEIIRGLLEAQGIPAMLSVEGAARAIGVNIGPFGEVEILVPEEYADQAFQVLADYRAGVFASQEYAVENDAGTVEEPDHDQDQHELDSD